MLDRMRRHQSWLKWILGIVVVAFIFIYVPQFLRPSGTGAMSTDTSQNRCSHQFSSARIGAYNQRVQHLRNAYGDRSTIR
jgi:hypothetical protein